MSEALSTAALQKADPQRNRLNLRAECPGTELLSTEFLKARIAAEGVKVGVEPKKRWGERDMDPR